MRSNRQGGALVRERAQGWLECLSTIAPARKGSERARRAPQLPVQTRLFPPLHETESSPGPVSFLFLSLAVFCVFPAGHGSSTDDASLFIRFYHTRSLPNSDDHNINPTRCYRFSRFFGSIANCSLSLVRSPFDYLALCHLLPAACSVLLDHSLHRPGTAAVAISILSPTTLPALDLACDINAALASIWVQLGILA
jgi:hypothetical protein